MSFIAHQDFLTVVSASKASALCIISYWLYFIISQWTGFLSFQFMGQKLGFLTWG